MKRRNRFKDRKSAGRSEIVPFLPGEKAGRRHTRRLKTNLQLFRDEASKWCNDRLIFLTIGNKGHHWKFTRDGKIVEWWPSSAKFVANKDYRNGIHVHDWNQARNLIAEFFGESVDSESRAVPSQERSDAQHCGDRPERDVHHSVDEHGNSFGDGF